MSVQADMDAQVDDSPAAVYRVWGYAPRIGFNAIVARWLFRRIKTQWLFDRGYYVYTAFTTSSRPDAGTMISLKHTLDTMPD